MKKNPDWLCKEISAGSDQMFLERRTRKLRSEISQCTRSVSLSSSSLSQKSIVYFWLFFITWDTLVGTTTSWSIPINVRVTLTNCLARPKVASDCSRQSQWVGKLSIVNFIIRQMTLRGGGASKWAENFLRRPSRKTSRISMTKHSSWISKFAVQWRNMTIITFLRSF